MKKTILQNHKIYIFILVGCVIVTSFWLDKFAAMQHDYQGIPPVPCVDATKNIVQDFTFTIKILINNRTVGIPSVIGHDPGKCLRVIYTKDTTGTVYITSNDTTGFTLNDFFEVWHKNFYIPQFDDQKEINRYASVGVWVNGRLLNSAADTPLQPNDDILVSYTQP